MKLRPFHNDNPTLTPTTLYPRSLPRSRGLDSTPPKPIRSSHFRVWAQHCCAPSPHNRKSTKVWFFFSIALDSSPLQTKTQPTGFPCPAGCASLSIDVLILS